jgi:hypothetical protein
MTPNSRREFLSDVGRGMLVAGLGSGLAADLGLASKHAFAEDAKARLTFGPLESLASLMQDTPAEKLLPLLIAKMKDGTDLRTLVSAGALANARCFGGQDYTGYHAFMALPPALEMAKEMTGPEAAVPVLKVLYRNTARMQAHGGATNEVLHPISHGNETCTVDILRGAVHKADVTKAESAFAAMPSDAYDQLLAVVQDEIDVHRVVLAWRAWTMIDVAGKDHAHTLLRQSVRFCVDSEKNRIERKRNPSEIRELLPKLLDEHKLIARGTGTKPADDIWVESLAKTIYGESRERAATAVAMALAEGFSPEAVGEAMSLASTNLVLRDRGRERDEEGKPKGSVHGASVGVHASDSANAWRNIARVGSPRNRVASLIVGAYHTAGQNNGQVDRPKNESAPSSADGPTLLASLDRAVRANDQATAVTLAERYATAGHDVEPFFQTLRVYAISEDGALHAEKYYRTIREEYSTTRKAFRGRHLAALARVTASEHGFPAPGYAEARRLVG